jgi:virulence-associated protein VagC
MIIREASTSIVIVGAWNPAILSPEWLARWAFGRAQGDQVQVQMEFSSIPKSPPILTIDQVIIIPSESRLVIRPQRSSEDLISRAEGVAVRILETLPHTPVRAFGENIEFDEEHASEEDTRMFRIHDHFSGSPQLEGLERKEMSIVDSYATRQNILKITRTLSGESFSIKFNFHYDVTSTEQATEQIRGTFLENFRRSCALISGVYDLPIPLLLGEAHA